jgi:4-amino-4-deoxy-L-arabinose transferase-like glycosyltransferase
MQEKIKLLPLLLLYILYILLASKDLASENALTFNVAEPRYAMFANNLSHGYYSPRDDIEPEYPEVRLFQVSVLNREDIYLWSGPGYPIVLLPFVLLRMPWLLARLLNAFFLFGAVLYFYRTLRFYMSERPSLYFSFLLGVYPPFFARLHLLLTETLTVFLICGFMFHFCKLSQNKKGSWTHLLMAGFFLGYLALTKILFGYVIITSLTVSLLLYAWKRTDRFKRAVWVCCFALLTCLPYLFYTYSLTGKVFYWANSGGMSLYWMSTPYEGELKASLTTFLGFLVSREMKHLRSKLFAIFSIILRNLLLIGWPTVVVYCSTIRILILPRNYQPTPISFRICLLWS